MTQLETTEQNNGSGKAVAKHASRFSAAFWTSRVYRPTYTRDGDRHEIAEWFARVQYAGRREAVGLGTNAREEAGKPVILVLRPFLHGVVVAPRAGQRQTEEGHARGLGQVDRIAMKHEEVGRLLAKLATPRKPWSIQSRGFFATRIDMGG